MEANEVRGRVLSSMRTALAEQVYALDGPAEHEGVDGRDTGALRAAGRHLQAAVGELRDYVERRR